MPEVIVYAVEGRSPQQKRALMKDITDAVVKNFAVKPEQVVVSIMETARTDKAKGGIPFSEMASPPQAKAS
jgi:4-oxalocrotonate tautomerase